MLKRSLIFVHRWLGVALSLLFLIWFPSAIGIMYWDYPGVTAPDRLERSPALDPATVKLAPVDAIAAAGLNPPSQVRLNTFDGRPAYRFRVGRGETLVYADTGERQADVTPEVMQRAAAAWTSRPADDASVEKVLDVDQWTLQLRAAGQLWKYSWPTGEQVYVSERTGEVVQYTTRGSRIGAYLGPIPHWFYFTPLRKHGPTWSRIVIWTSGIGTLTALLGVVIGIWVYSPSKRYRMAGAATSIPYQGQKRWHMVLGLIFGVASVTWVFSGMLSMEPFPLSREPDEEPSNHISQALRPSMTLTGFAGEHPRDVLEKLPGLDVRELEWTSFAGQPLYLATLGNGETRIVPVNSQPRTGFDQQQIVDVVTPAAAPAGLRDVRLLTQYDRYYLDRRRERPLPVLLFRVADADDSRYYVDLKTGRLVGSYSQRNWFARWAYHGLHSFDFPWLYNHRPLWDIVVIAFMLGGTSLAVTSLILAWRVLGRKLQRA